MGFTKSQSFMKVKTHFMALGIVLNFALPILCGGCRSQTKAPPQVVDERPFPTHAFTALYESPENGQRYTSKVISDGNGHLRLEFSSQAIGSPIVVLVDLRADSWYNCDTRKWAPLTSRAFFPTNRTVFVNGAVAQRFGYVDLGHKKINGIHCHGWRTGDRWNDRIVWVDESTEAIVQQRFTRETGDGMVLKQLSTAPPEPALFQALSLERHNDATTHR